MRQSDVTGRSHCSTRVDIRLTCCWTGPKAYTYPRWPARNGLPLGAIQSDAALRQSTEGRQMGAATLSVGVLLAILEAAPEIRVPFRVDSHHSSKLGGKSQGGRRDRNQPYRESPQRECITL